MLAGASAAGVPIRLAFSRWCVAALMFVYRLRAQPRVLLNRALGRQYPTAID